MHRLARLPALVLALAVLAPGCKKPAEEDTTPPDDPSKQVEGAGPTEQADPGPPQEPDPPEIAEARRQYLLGNYEQVVSTLQPICDDLTERQQFRASGLCTSWLALALTQDVAENAKGPSEYAVTMADKTGDPEVVQAAKTAHGAYLLGVMDFTGAATDLKAAVDANSAGTDAGLALILGGEATMNTAFEDDKVVRPGALDEAGMMFEKALSLIRDTGPEDKAVRAKAIESIAGIASFKGDNTTACARVNEAVKLYEEAGASDFLTSGADALRQKAKCGK